MTGPAYPRGTTNTNTRGSAEDRRRRRAWLLRTFDLDLGPEVARCALAIHPDCHGTVTDATMQVDRIVSGLHGGRYVRGNIRPACPPCNHQRGTEEREALHRATCRGACRRCRAHAAVRDDYAAAREAAERQREAVTAGYATESQLYGPLLTFRQYLEQTRGTE